MNEVKEDLSVKEEVEDLTMPEIPVEVALEEIVALLALGSADKSVEAGLKALVGLIKQNLKNLNPEEFPAFLRRIRTFPSLTSRITHFYDFNYSKSPSLHAWSSQVIAHLMGEGKDAVLVFGTLERQQLFLSDAGSSQEPKLLAMGMACLGHLSKYGMIHPANANPVIILVCKAIYRDWNRIVTETGMMLVSNLLSDFGPPPLECVTKHIIPAVLHSVEYTRMNPEALKSALWIIHYLCNPRLEFGEIVATHKSMTILKNVFDILWKTKDEGVKLAAKRAFERLTPIVGMIDKPHAELADQISVGTMTDEQGPSKVVRQKFGKRKQGKKLVKKYIFKVTGDLHYQPGSGTNPEDLKIQRRE